MANVNQNLNTFNTWQNKLDFFTSSSPAQQPESLSVTSVALKNLPQITENKNDIINQTISVWQSWKNGDIILKKKAQAIFLNLHEEYVGKETPLELLDEMMSEWQKDPILLTNVARNLEKNNSSLFKELQDKKLVFSVRIGETGETRLYSKALLKTNAPYLFRMIKFSGAEIDPNTGTVTLPEDAIFNYMLEDLESSLIDDPLERKKEQIAKASEFIANYDSFDDLISDVLEYNFVFAEDALVNLVGDHVLNPTKESSKFLQKVLSSESLLNSQAAELKKNIETVYKTLISLKIKPYFDLSKLIITDQRELDEIIKDIETVTGSGYALHINELIIKNIEGLTSINLSSIPKSAITRYGLVNLDSLETINVGQVENVRILYCNQLKTIKGTAKTWNLFDLNALRTVHIGQAENVYIDGCYKLEAIQGTAKTWILDGLNALRTVNIGQAENVKIRKCRQLTTIQGTAKTWELVDLKALTMVDIVRAENVEIQYYDQLETIQGTAKAWITESLEALKTANFGQAENVDIRSCEKLETIQGTAKTWELVDLKSLTTVDIGQAENVTIRKCIQLTTIQGTAKTWELVALDALTMVDIRQAQNVNIQSCDQLTTIQGTAKTWDLLHLKTLTTVDLNKSETVNIMDCPLYKT